MRARDTTVDAHEVQLSIYRRMTPQERLQIGLDLSALSRSLLEQGIRARHPNYSDEEVRLATIRRLLGHDLFRAAYPDAPLLEP